MLFLFLWSIAGTVFTRITAELFAKCCGKAAGIAETHHISDLCHGIQSALYQGKSLGCSVLFKIACDRLSGHFPEQTRADFAGEVDLIRQCLQGKDGVKVRM